MESLSPGNSVPEHRLSGPLHRATDAVILPVLSLASTLFSRDREMTKSDGPDLDIW